MSFYWFDYETFGTHPALDRPAQFAGVRTDDQLNPVGEPLCIYCRPANDYLPAPEACMITGITPQVCLQQGIPECAFIERIHHELATPGTCNIGYNNIRFDDEFTRHILYRNFFDPYEHEWKNGNSRWDLLDVVRLTRALRPEGIYWPTREDGSINNTLEALTQSNGISHQHAHDALSDVYATIEIARLLKTKKAKLFNYVFSHRDKHSIASLLNLKNKASVVHVSGMISSEYLHTAVIIPLIKHPSNSNGILVYDLRFDPSPFLALSVDELRERLFTANLERVEDRLPVKTIHINRCPIVVPLNTLDAAARERTRISLSDSEKHAVVIRKHPDFSHRVQQAFAGHEFAKHTDTDQMLYSGGFFTESDKRAFERLRRMSPQELSVDTLFFDDARIPEMLKRYKARNYPDSLSAAETQHWEEDRLEKIHSAQLNRPGYDEYLKNLQDLKNENPDKAEILEELSRYVRSLGE